MNICDDIVANLKIIRRSTLTIALSKQKSSGSNPAYSTLLEKGASVHLFLFKFIFSGSFQNSYSFYQKFLEYYMIVQKCTPSVPLDVLRYFTIGKELSYHKFLCVISLSPYFIITISTSYRFAVLREHLDE